MARKFLKIKRRVPRPEEEQPAEERPPEEQPAAEEPAEEEPAEEQLAEEEQPAEQPAEEPLQLLGVKVRRDGTPIDHNWDEWVRILTLVPYYGTNEEQVCQNLPDLLRKELVSTVREGIDSQEFFLGKDLSTLRDASDSEVFHACISSHMKESNKGEKKRKIAEGEDGYIKLTIKEIKEEEDEKRRRREEKEEEERRRQMEEEERRAWGEDPEPGNWN